MWTSHRADRRSAGVARLPSRHQRDPGTAVELPDLPVGGAGQERSARTRSHTARTRRTTQQAHEYGFWANVNPEVPHPRWSQATERILQTGERVPTLLFNGYGEYVADMYKDIEGEKLFM